MAGISLSYFIQRLRNNTLQNIGGDYLENVDWVYQVNTALIFFFNYMNSNGPWYHANVYQTLTSTNPAGDTVWPLTYTIGRVFQVVNGTINKKLVQNNVNSNYNSPDITNGFFISSDTDITTEAAITELKVWYQRLPIWHDYTNLNVDIDIPQHAIGILEFLVLWRIMPIHLEQGAQLANNYFSQAQTSMKEYAQNIGYTNSMRNIITGDQFNYEQSAGTFGKVF